MSALSEIVEALNNSGVHVTAPLGRINQGTILTVQGYPISIRLYAWYVTDNGQATGIARPLDERRIQASTSNWLEASSNPETLILGWSDELDTPLIVAFNPFSVTNRVNAKLNRKLADGDASPRVSDSQQFRQGLLVQAAATGIAEGVNQHGEHVVAMRPEHFFDYLNQIKPRLHVPLGFINPQQGSARMVDLVEEASIEDAEPWDGIDALYPAPFDPSAIEDGRERVAREIAIRRGQATFRRSLIEAYGCCAMSGSTVLAALEAAHIVPYRGPGTHHLSNGLLLRADLHTLFDLGLLAVDPASLQILVSFELMETDYAGFSGRQIIVPEGHPGPSRDALALHRSLAGL